MLTDQYGREINYLRLAVTDRCNLRCFYCMPEQGIQYIDRKDLLSFEEMYRLIRVSGTLGISKVRITGGEPFVRKGIMDFLGRIAEIQEIEQINITTNGSFTKNFIPELEQMGIHSINLSLDSLDKKRFFEITRKNLFDQVMDTFYALLDSDMHIKTNMVVMEGRNIDDIYPMLELTRDANVSVRFIEEMPFNGSPDQGNATIWPLKRILDHIKQRYDVEKLTDQPNSTSQNYRIKGHKGTFGIIAAYTRTFCGSCNRIRITPQGGLRTCLYSNESINLRDIIRSGVNDLELADQLQNAVKGKSIDGFEAERLRISGTPASESMATIGG
jgi:molybdenum cofactor biosynthesis protein A